MLFDLRGRGRRRAVQGIYLFLAILMGGGLIFFGIGGNVSGGLFDALSDSSNNSADSGFQKRLETAKKRAVAQPTSAPAQAAYLKVQVEELAGPKYSDPNTGALTDDGKKKFPEVEASWDKYVKLNPDPVDLTVATRMAFLYESLATWAKAAGAWDAYLSTAKKPVATQFASLAVDAYRAGQIRKGDLARARALELAPKNQRNQLKQNIDAVKAQAVTQQLQDAGAGTSTTG